MALNILGNQFVAQLEEAGFAAVAVTASNDSDQIFTVSLIVFYFKEENSFHHIGRSLWKVPHSHIQSRNSN